MPSSRPGKARARIRPAGSSSHAQAYTHSPGGGTVRSSTSAALPYRRSVRGGTHSARASIQQNSPSCRAPTTPAGVTSSGTSSSHAVPTQGCPAKGSRSVGV